MTDAETLEVLRASQLTLVRTIKTCPHCESDVLISLSSIDQHICNNCCKPSDWKLKPGQPSVLIEGKVG